MINILTTNQFIYIFSYVYGPTHLQTIPRIQQLMSFPIAQFRFKNFLIENLNCTSVKKYLRTTQKWGLFLQGVAANHSCKTRLIGYIDTVVYISIFNFVLFNCFWDGGLNVDGENMRAYSFYIFYIYTIKKLKESIIVSLGEIIYYSPVERLRYQVFLWVLSLSVA